MAAAEAVRQKERDRCRANKDVNKKVVGDFPSALDNGDVAGLGRLLDPTVQAPAAPAQTTVPGRGVDLTIEPDTCWPDYIIRAGGGM